MYRVFVKPGCSICRSVVERLDSKEIPYEKVDVTTTAGWEMAKSLNINRAGTIVDEEGNIKGVEEL